MFTWRFFSPIKTIQLQIIVACKCSKWVELQNRVSKQIILLSQFIKRDWMICSLIWLIQFLMSLFQLFFFCSSWVNSSLVDYQWIMTKCWYFSNANILYGVRRTYAQVKWMLFKILCGVYLAFLELYSRGNDECSWKKSCMLILQEFRFLFYWRKRILSFCNDTGVSK